MLISGITRIDQKLIGLTFSVSPASVYFRIMMPGGAGYYGYPDRDNFY